MNSSSTAFAIGLFELIVGDGLLLQFGDYLAIVVRLEAEFFRDQRGKDAHSRAGLHNLDLGPVPGLFQDGNRGSVDARIALQQLDNGLAPLGRGLVRKHQRNDLEHGSGNACPVEQPLLGQFSALDTAVQLVDQDLEVLPSYWVNPWIDTRCAGQENG